MCRCSDVPPALVPDELSCGAGAAAARDTGLRAVCVVCAPQPTQPVVVSGT